jgi:hypothetical protein
MSNETHPRPNPADALLGFRLPCPGLTPRARSLFTGTAVAGCRAPSTKGAPPPPALICSCVRVEDPPWRGLPRALPSPTLLPHVGCTTLGCTRKGFCIHHSRQDSLDTRCMLHRAPIQRGPAAKRQPKRNERGGIPKGWCQNAEAFARQGPAETRAPPAAAGWWANPCVGPADAAAGSSPSPPMPQAAAAPPPRRAQRAPRRAPRRPPRCPAPPPRSRCWRRNRRRPGW